MESVIDHVSNTDLVFIGLQILLLLVVVIDNRSVIELITRVAAVLLVLALFNFMAFANIHDLPGYYRMVAGGIGTVLLIGLAGIIAREQNRTSQT